MLENVVVNHDVINEWIIIIIIIVYSIPQYCRYTSLSNVELSVLYNSLTNNYPYRTTEVQSVDNPGEVIEPVKVPQLQSHGHQQQGSRGD